LLFGIYLLTFSGRYHSSDEVSMLAATDSLARRGAWDVELIHWMGEQQASFGPDGLLYSRKGIGTTLAALPFYWLAVQFPRVGNVQAAMLTNGFLTALAAVLVYLLVRRLRYGEAVSLGTALAFGLGTMAWPYARYLFSETLAGLGLIASAYFLVRYRDEVDRVSPLLAGAGLGVALLARLNNAIVAPFLGLLLLAYLGRRHGRRWRAWIVPVVSFAVPVLASLAVAGWYNWLRFGSPWNTGYLPAERFATPFFQGLYGLTFSPGKGLFWYNPLLFAAVAAWPLFYRQHRAEALLAGSVVLSNVAFYAPWYLWWAGHGWGPRFLVTILPFAALPLAPALAAMTRRRALAFGLGVLAAASVAVQVLGVAVDFSQYLDDVYARLGLYHPATLFDPAYSPLLRQWAYLRPGNLDLAWARGGVVNWPALLSGVAVVLAAGLALAAARRGRWRPWAGGGLALLLVLGAAYSLLRYAPQDDVAAAARTLSAAERPGEAAALTDELLTEPFQDAYDGHLWVWGVPVAEDVGGEHDATWTVGPGGAEQAAARVQVGTVRLDYLPVSGEPFDAGRLPIQPVAEKMELGNVAELVGAEIDGPAAQPGGTLGLALGWRALAPTDTSYTVFVQLIDEQGVKAGQIDRRPCDDGCPTTTWRPGDLVGEWFDIPIRPGAPPGRYRLVTGMYDLETGQNLAWRDALGREIGPLASLGTVQIGP
jgi:hypothetical protein